MHQALAADPARALRETIVAVDRALRKESSIDAQQSGTTAVVCLCRAAPDGRGLRVYAANVGDSRAIVAAAKRPATNGTTATNAATATNTAAPQPLVEASALTVDQKPDDPRETRRIRAAGGYVSLPGPARLDELPEPCAAATREQGATGRRRPPRTQRSARAGSPIARPPW